MTNNGLLRGIILFVCAQIPLLMFFLYLLYIGVGLSDFANLSDSRHLDRKSVIGWAEDRDDKLKKQVFAETVRINQKLNNLQTSLADLEAAGTARQSDVLQKTNEQVSSLQRQINEFTDRFTALQTSLQAPEKSASETPADLISRLQALAMKASALQLAHSQMTGRMGKLDADVAKLFKAVEDIQAHVAEVKASLAGGESQRVAINRTLSAHENTLARHDEQFAQIGDMSEQMNSALASGIKPIEARIASLTQGIATLSRDMSSLSKDVETLASAPSGPALPSAEDLLKKHAELFAPPPERKPVAELQFAANDWQLNPEANRALNTVITRLRKSREPVRVGIYGFTVKHGPLNFSMALADKRARIVAETIREAGVVNQPITIFVVPEYRAYRDRDVASGTELSATNSQDAVHIYLDKE